MTEKLGSPSPGQPPKKVNLSRSEIDSLISIFDRTEPASVYNMLSPEFQAAIDAMCANKPHVLRYSLKTLDKGEFDLEVYKLRLSFWREYDEATMKHQRMSVDRILRGICTKFYLKEHVYKNERALMFILHQPQDYIQSMTECLDLAAKNIRRILMMPDERPFFDKDGIQIGVKLDHAIVNQKIKIWEKLENRIKGIAPQTLKITQTSKNYNYNKNEVIEAPRSVEELEAEIKKLEEVVVSPLVIESSGE